MGQSVFAKEKLKVYQHRWEGTLEMETIVGGVPSDPKVIRGWLKTNLGISNEDILREKVAEVMVERGLDPLNPDHVREATEEVAESLKLNGFKRDPERKGELYIEGRQLKACLKENANIAYPGERWGPTRKGTKSYWAEHVFVTETKLYLGVYDGDRESIEVNQRFVSTRFGNSISYEELCRDVSIDFTIIADVDIPHSKWSEIWCRAEENGLGAVRSQGFGKFSVVKWDKIDLSKAGRKSKKAAA